MKDANKCCECNFSADSQRNSKIDIRKHARPGLYDSFPRNTDRGEAGKGDRWAKGAINDILIVTCCMKF